MRSFNDFLNSFGPEEFMAIINDANQKAVEIKNKTSTPDELPLGNIIAITSYTISLELLGLYHKWLSEE